MCIFSFTHDLLTGYLGSSTLFHQLLTCVTFLPYLLISFQPSRCNAIVLLQQSCNMILE